MDDDGGGNSNDDLRKERERVCGDVTKCRKNTGTQSKPFHVKVAHLFMVINTQDITVNKVHTKLICYQVYPKQFNRSLKKCTIILNVMTQKYAAYDGIMSSQYVTYL